MSVLRCWHCKGVSNEQGKKIKLGRHPQTMLTSKAQCSIFKIECKNHRYVHRDVHKMAAKALYNYKQCCGIFLKTCWYVFISLFILCHIIFKKWIWLNTNYGLERKQAKSAFWNVCKGRGGLAKCQRYRYFISLCSELVNEEG